MKYSYKKIGFFQATALLAYIFFVALSLWATSGFSAGEALSPVVTATIFLSFFVISALISGSAVLGYPIFLFFENKRREALMVVIWSVVWFVIMVVLIAVISLLMVNFLF